MYVNINQHFEEESRMQKVEFSTLKLEIVNGDNKMSLIRNHFIPDEIGSMLRILSMCKNTVFDRVYWVKKRQSPIALQDKYRIHQ